MVIDNIAAFELDGAMLPDDAIESSDVVRTGRFSEDERADGSIAEAVSDGVVDRIVALGRVQVGRPVYVVGTHPFDVVIGPIAHDVGLMYAGLYHGSPGPCAVRCPDSVLRSAAFFGVGVFHSVPFHCSLGDHRDTCDPLA